MRRKHAMEAFAGFFGRGREFFKPDGGVYQVAQDCFAGGGVSRQIGIDCLGKHRLVKFGIALNSCDDRFPESLHHCFQYRRYRLLLQSIGNANSLSGRRLLARRVFSQRAVNSFGIGEELV